MGFIAHSAAGRLHAQSGLALAFDSGHLGLARGADERLDIEAVAGTGIAVLLAAGVGHQHQILEAGGS